MPTLSDSRRASGKAIQDSRRASGEKAQDDRRAINDRLEMSRRGTAQIVDDINRLTVPQKEPRRLRKLEKRGALPPKDFTATNPAIPIKGGASGGGIASPLTETPNSRTYYDETSSLYSSDYMLAVEIEPLKSVTMTDADSQTVVFNWALPPGVTD